MAYEIYRLTLKGHLDAAWSAWFDGLTVTMTDNGETILTGPVVDQTALHGVLIKIRDLGLPLLALTRIDPGSADPCTGVTDTRHQEQKAGSASRLVQ
jgi:hypothetical protein